MQSTTPPTLLQVDQLACERDERSLFVGLQFTVKAGEIWHIKGPNGAGKTSLLRQLAGLLPVDQGQVSFPTGKQLLYIGHKLSIKDQLSANENLSWLTALTVSSTENQRYAALEKVGLRGYEESLAAQLSAGQRRRIALARLHLNPAPLWLLDEPLTAMDQQGVMDEQRWFVEHLRTGGAIVLTSHQDLLLDNVKILDLSAAVEAAL
ncbi:MAG: cytochrome c biogenesis heme-transporting ATPase CcmA [Gammaproteobacteria bacterium]|jgi:heme exporter protein A|nr:cytochrome c biogenesis heme-transporting ATPase CcmA [Gammaproteobacteria bacterium]